MKSQNGPRSNFSLLPFEVQYKMIAMLQDGATFATIAADNEIAEAYRARGLRLVPPAVSRLKKSDQYRSWTSQRLKERSSFTADRLTTAFLRENNSLDTIAEQTKVALLKVVQECVDGAENPQEVERLVRSAATLANTAKDARISELDRKLALRVAEVDELKAALAASEVSHAAEIKRLTVENDRLKSLAGTVDNDDVIKKLNESVGL